MTVPAAPAPLARFKVLDAGTAALLEQLERDHSESHVLLGILNLHAGIRAGAERHLKAVPPSDPFYAVARRSLERLAALTPQ